MWWVSTARYALLRKSTEWQQAEQLSKVAKHDLAQEHQPQPNSSAYLLTVLFGELTLFYLSFTALRPSPFLPWQCKRATSVHLVMRRWVSLSLCFFQFPLRFQQLPFLNICFCLSKDCLYHVTSLAAKATQVFVLLLAFNLTISETCMHCAASKLLTSWNRLRVVLLAVAPS